MLYGTVVLFHDIRTKRWNWMPSKKNTTIYYQLEKIRDRWMGGYDAHHGTPHGKALGDGIRCVYAIADHYIELLDVYDCDGVIH